MISSAENLYLGIFITTILLMRKKQLPIFIEKKYNFQDDQVFF